MGFLSGLAGVAFGKGLDFLSSSALQQDALDFQKKYARTKHQWEVDDLRKAGLNPILSAKFGGSGTSAAIPSTGAAGNPLLVSAQAAKMKAEADESRERTKVLESQGRSASAQAVMDDITKERKVREFENMDQADYAKDALPYVEGMPKGLRGPTRLGVTAAGAVGAFGKAMLNRMLGRRQAVRDANARARSNDAAARGFDIRPFTSDRQQRKMAGHELIKSDTKYDYYRFIGDDGEEYYYKHIRKGKK